MPLLLRRLLFYLFAVIFVAVSTIVVLYTLGWHINLAYCDWRKILTCPIEQTGAVFIETSPRGVEITLDDKNYADSSSIIESGTLIRNLPPGNHFLSIKKDGYMTWQKNLTVLPGRVAEALDVILIPKTLTSQSLPFSALRGETISSANSRGDKFIVKNESAGIFYLYDANSPQTVLNLSLTVKNLTRGNLRAVSFSPLDDTTIVAATDAGLYFIDLRRTQITLIAPARTNWDINNDTIYYSTTTPSLTKRFSLITRNPLANESIQMATTTIAGIKASGDRRAVLDDKKNLYLEIDGEPARKLSDRAESFSFSPDGRKLAYFLPAQAGRAGEILVYLIDDLVRLNKTAGQTITLNLTGDFSSFSWHADSEHLIVNYGGPSTSSGQATYRAELAELDDREPLNRYDLIDGASSVYYETSSGRLFFVRKNLLFSLSI